MDGNTTTRSAGRGGAWSLAAARESAREDEQACEAGGDPKRRRESAADDIQYSHGGDGKRVRGCDNGGAPGAIVGYSGGQLHCSDEDEETQSLLFSSNPRAAASGNVLDPSGSGENVQQLRLFEIDPAKHKIFLSHSGAQKNFVEQLCVDLEARGYLFPFFDQRHHSLPEGKDFAPLINQAARLCHVAVIVLSEEFLCSKWPMMELAEFHAAKQGGNRRMRMLPLFFKLKVGDLDDESINVRWMPVWNELARRDKRIDVSGWVAAVRALRGLSGLSFGKHSNSEVGYRKEIVGSIWKISPGDLAYDSAREMVGYDRICEKVSKEFVKCERVGASVLGLYGTSGLGKTTVAKALCDYFAGEFEGRVCHVEMGAMTRMKRQEWILKTLCGVEKDMLRRLPDDRKGLKVMRDCMSREPVLLVIDNLSNDVSSRREAHEYLTVGFHPKSKVMITARSKEVLQDLVPGMNFCMSIPKLNEEEAGMIFLRSAAPMKCFSSVTDEERRVLRRCVEKCLLDGFGYQGKILGDSVWTIIPRYGAYHPLALSALGDYFYRLSANTGMLQWKDSLERDRGLMRDVLQSPSITSIIHLQFSTFSWNEQLLFLDIALFLDAEPESFMSKGNTESSFGTYTEWLSMMHGDPTSVVERRLRDLKRSGMIDWGEKDYFEFEFEVHSLCSEFAEWYMTEHGVSGLKNAWGVFQPCGASLGSDHGGSKCISDLVRLRVFNIPRASIWILTRMRELHNLVLLQLFDCPNLRVLSLAGLDSLRQLELRRLRNLVTVTLTESSGAEEVGGIFESLLHVVLEHLDSLTHVPDLRSCTLVRFLPIRYCEKVSNFDGMDCPHLEEIRLTGLTRHQLGRLPNIKSLHCLTKLYIQFDGRDVIDDAMEFASPYKWKQRRRGQFNVALQDCDDSIESCEDSDEFSDDSDAYHFVEQDDEVTEKTIMYVRREKQYVKEGLSIVQNAMSYVYEQRWCYTGHHENPSYFAWRFDEGDQEKICWLDTLKKLHVFEWRFRNAEAYDVDSDVDSDVDPDFGY